MTTIWLLLALVASWCSQPAQPPSTASPAKPVSATPPAVLRAVILDLASPEGDAAAPGQKLPIVRPSADDFLRVIPILEQEKINLVVIRVDISDSFKATAPDALHDVTALVHAFQDQYAPRFRTVAWIKRGAGTGALAVWGIAEHYYLATANIGAMVPQATDAGQAVRGKELESWLQLGELASTYGRRDPQIARAMLAGADLSADLANGEVLWRRDLKGEHVFTKEIRVLCLSADQAVRFKLARGIATTADELAAALGNERVEWIESRAAESLSVPPGR